MSDDFKASGKQTFQTGIAPKSKNTKSMLVANCPKSTTTGTRGKREKTTRYLVFGFDTEYVAHKTVTKDQIKDEETEIKNEILSYQYSLKIVSEDQNENNSVEGIIIPQNGEIIELAAFITFALAHFGELHPNVIIPEQVYLVAHFTRADLPGFSGFRNIAKRHLSNIRNTFVSLGSYIPLVIHETDGTQIARFKVRLRDTVLLAPANAKKLAEVGEIVGIAKMKLGEDSQEELRIKTDGMKNLRDTDWEVFREYAIRDALICVRYAEKLMRQNFELSENLELPVTLTSFGVNMVQKSWRNKDWELNEILGREQVKVKSYNKSTNRYTYKTERPFIEEIYYESSLAVEAYHGGRNEQYMFGICDRGVWRDHDLSSAYTTAMSLIGKPDWENIKTINSAEEIAVTDLAFFWIEFEFPEKVRFPTLPVRCDGGIIFPRKGKSKCAAPEIILAKHLGAEIRIKKAVYVPSNKQCPIFKDFIVECITNRSKFKKGTFENLFWKEVGNSTYGKTAQGLKKKRVYDMRDDNMVTLPESQLTQPFLAAFITSYTRAVLGEVLNGFSNEVDVFSVTTDGFLSNASDEELEKATDGEIFQKFRGARLALESSSEALEVKHEIKRPIGWRTRGSATIEKGEGPNNILLQKGGIKLDANYDLEQENTKIINLFLNRHARQQLEYRIGIGLKDMIHHDADFVSRSITKRLSMEFDWKRKPVAPQDVEVVFCGKKYNHLSFKTEPLKDKEEYDNIRSTWELYTKGDNNTRTLLKTVDDLEQYENYRFQKANKHGRERSYVNKTDADIKNLKRSLCRAFKHQKAGFKSKLNGKKITHKMFMEQLNGVQIPCSISDLDNAKRFEFHPHTAGYTSRAAKAARRLKSAYYNDLDLSVIFNEKYLENYPEG